ncbi:MAG: tetratricopeptide repeat protein, partial [Candidatus Omnitrophota bacterium]
IYGGMGKMEESIVLLKKAIEINPYDSWSYNSLGIAYGNVGKREEAIASFKKAIKIDPDLAAAQYNLAIMYYYAEKYDLAIEHCDRAVELRYRVNPAFLKSLEPYRKSKETPQ